MTYSAAVLSLNPIRYFKLDEASGTTLVDSSPSNANGAYGGSVTFSAAGAVDSGSAVTFDGASGFASCGDIPPDFSTAFTFTAWVKVETGGAYRTIFSKFDTTGARFEVSLGKGGEYGSDLGVVVSINEVSPYTAAVFTVGTWHHLVVVYDGEAATKLRVYVDNVQIALSGSMPTASDLGALSAANSYLASRAGGAPFLHGALDDVALFNAALTTTAVANLYAGVPTVAATLTAATVQANGAEVALVFDAAAELSATDLLVTSSGAYVHVSAVTGAGTAWTAKLGNRWVRSSSAVTVKYKQQSAIGATNNSLITDQQIGYVGRRFGMFVHYGIETYLNIEWSTGAESANTFAPTGDIRAGIDTWISGAISAGMRSIVLTAKHHGGFCLWPSSTSTHTVAQTAWYAANGSPDVLRIFVEKCRAAGLGVGVYFSVWDRWWEAQNPGFTYSAYTTHLQSQLTELLTQYGPIECLWFDGWGWAGSQDGVSFAQIPYASIKNHCKDLQPDCLVIVNNHEDTVANTEILEYELYIDGQPAAGNTLPLELCLTIRGDHAWFYKTAADTHVAATSINSNLATLNGNRGRLLLNCPPGLTGALPAQTQARLAEVGAATLESVSGISTSAGTLAQRTVSVTLTTNGTTPAANLSGLRWAWWDQATPNMARPPRAQGTGETTDASGVLSISVPSSLPVSGVGWLVVTNSAGNPASDHNAFSGPVAVI